MNQPKVSVIIPCYNHAQFLEHALDSVLNQTYTNWECIIINDGSEDDTDALAKKWCEKEDRFKYIGQKNGGLANARNEGIKISTGIYILPLDADDYIDKDFLTKLVPELSKDESLAIVSCYTKFFFKNTNTIIYELKPAGTYWKDLLYVNQLVATSLYRKKCWEEVGGYDETMKKGFEDWEFWIAITKSGWKYKIVEEFLFYYRKAKKSMLVDTINNHSETMTAYIFKKHKELYIQDFDNCMTVLFYHINTHRTSKMKIKNSLEYKMIKLLFKPFRMVQKLFSNKHNAK